MGVVNFFVRASCTLIALTPSLPEAWIRPSMASAQKKMKGAGYACTFVEQPPKLFMCEVCGLVLRDPQITQCCGKYACRSCIVKEAENGAPCPIPACQNQCITKIFPDRDLHYDIIKRRVYCTSEENGCQWVDTLENLEKHLLECPFLEEECQNSCGMKIQRRLVKEHEAICERIPVKCEQCGNLYERRDQSSHLDACLLTKVKCPFSIVGCTAEVLNKDLQQHFEESLSEHYTLVAKQSQDVQAEIGENSVILSQIKKNIKPLLAQSMEVAGINDELVAAEREITELQKTLEVAQLEVKELEQRHNRVSAELQQQISEREASICAVRKECDQLVFTSQVRCYGPALPHIHPADIVSRPLDSPVTTEEYVPQVSFKIPRFLEERKNGACMCLPPFYSHRGGYKMCLLVYCNGYLSVKGEYVSISIRVFSGNYDDKLDWPLHCRVEIEIPSARKSTANMKKSIEVKTKSPIPGERFSSQTLGICPHAVSLREGLGYEPISSYLEDGCLTIAVLRVAFNR